MARGRMISKSLSTSVKFARLQKEGGDFAQALYPLLVAHADDFGRQSGDAFTVKHTVLPTSPHSQTEFEQALTALTTVGLITRYGVPDGTGGTRIVLSIVNFEAHQSGLHKRTASHFPEIPGNPRKLPDIPGNSRTMFPEIPGNSGLREEKGRELKGREEKTYVPPMWVCPHVDPCPNKIICANATACHKPTKAG